MDQSLDVNVIANYLNHYYGINQKQAHRLIKRYRATHPIQADQTESGLAQTIAHQSGVLSPIVNQPITQLGQQVGLLAKGINQVMHDSYQSLRRMRFNQKGKP